MNCERCAGLLVQDDNGLLGIRCFSCGHRPAYAVMAKEAQDEDDRYQSMGPTYIRASRAKPYKRRVELSRKVKQRGPVV